MLFFAKREDAREFAKKNPKYKVVDMKNNPSVNRLRWAVQVL